MDIFMSFIVKKKKLKSQKNGLQDTGWVIYGMYKVWNAKESWKSTLRIVIVKKEKVGHKTEWSHF